MVKAVAQRFRCFGEGTVDPTNPIAKAFKSRPPMFAAGVDVAEVVGFVVAAIRLEIDPVVKKLQADLKNLENEVRREA
jgi:hypothetical protein